MPQADQRLDVGRHASQNVGEALFGPFQLYALAIGLRQVAPHDQVVRLEGQRTPVEPNRLLVLTLLGVQDAEACQHR